jgi:hypothetical protein
MQALEVSSDQICIEVPLSTRKPGKHIENQLEVVAQAFVKAELERNERRTSRDSKVIIF